jgi:L-alanine-DL-glutamate epimerase-like enolase superfamily enzyme
MTGGGQEGGAEAVTTGLGGFRLRGLRAHRLEVPLWEPFVIATGEIAATQAVLVEVDLVCEGPGGSETAGESVATGLGEAPTLAPVTDETQADMLRRAAELEAWIGRSWPSLRVFEDELAVTFPAHAVTRSGISGAVWDAVARAAGFPLAALLVAAYRAWGPSQSAGKALAAAAPPIPAPPAEAVQATDRAPDLLTDITLPISAPSHMAGLAAQHWARGFRAFKVKVGRDVATDLEALGAVAAAVPGARFRLDANAGYRAEDALAVLEAFSARGVNIECFEQPCGREDWEGNATVAARSPIPVVADESFRGAADLERIVRHGVADAVNLKLAKLGGPWPTLVLGADARAQGLALMAGAMVETRAGLATMGHVAAALNGLEAGEAVAWIDLDTAFLMREDPFDGGWTARGPSLWLGQAAGTGLRWRGSRGGAT